MKGDFARITFDPTAHFSRVLLQQGRVLLEADYNEQSAIFIHLLRSLVIDVIGRRWAAGSGFSIDEVAGPNDFVIRAGHYYIDGILCENETDNTYRTQPFWPVPEAGMDAENKPFTVYLDCWERHVTCIEEPRLREIALGGPDTTTRLQVAWQVRMLNADVATALTDPLVAAIKQQLDAAATPAEKNRLTVILNELTAAAAAFAAKPDDLDRAQSLLDRLDIARPRLAAAAKQAVADDDPCVLPGASQYRGYENNLYRLEIHDGGAAEQATFKWSRENGSVAFRVLTATHSVEAGASFVTVILDRLGPDRRYGLSIGDWVELGDDKTQYAQISPPLLQVVKVDRNRRAVTLQGAPAALRPENNIVLRRWDQSGPALPVTDASAAGAGGWRDLERGVQVCFGPNSLYRPGDYWVIPTRAATGDVEWPTLPVGTTRAALGPLGVAHHRAVLAGVRKAGAKWTATQSDRVHEPLLAP